MSKSALTKPTRPCDVCRKKKRKCVFEEGESKCFLCRFHNHACEFNLPPVQKRKKSVSNVELGPSPEGIDFLSAPQSTHDSPSSPGISSVNSPSRGTIGGNIDPDPVTNANTTTTTTTTTTFTPHNRYFLNGNDEIDKYIFLDLLQSDIVLTPIATDAPIKRSIHRVSSDSLFLHVERTQQQLNASNRYHDKINLIVGDLGPKLVSLYFRIVHSSFPILYKDKFLQQFDRQYKQISPALLACLYVFALNWWNLDTDIASILKPSQSQLENIAESSLSDEIKTPNIETVQAGLLLIQHQSFRDKYENPNYSFPMQASILAVAQCIGLNRTPDHWDLPDWEKSLRKRLAWALYVQEKWLSLCVDKPSHIHDDDWAVGDLDETKDFSDFNDVGIKATEGMIDLNSGKTLFLQMIELSKIVDVILKKLYSVKAQEFLASLGELSPLDQLKQLLNYIKPLQLKLTDWELTLPKALVIETKIKRGFISGAPNIYISNFTAQITILRPVLRLIAMCKQKQLVVDDEFMKIRDIVFKKSNTSVQNVLNFLNEIKAEHLQTFWYTSVRVGLSFIVVFGYLLAFISKDSEELDLCVDKLEDFLWKLKINNKNAEFFLHSVVWWNQLHSLVKFSKQFFNEQTETPSRNLSLDPRLINVDTLLLPDLFNLENIDSFVFNFRDRQ